MSVASWCCKSFCVVPCVSFCKGHFVMVPLNITCLHCLQHSLFEHIFNLYSSYWPANDCMLQITVTLTVDLLTHQSIGIIYGPWPTKTPIMVSLSLIGFKLLSERGFMSPITVTLTFDLLTPTSTGNICWSWPTKTLIMVSLSSMNFKLLSGQGFYAPGRCDIDLWPTDLKINWDNIWIMATKLNTMGSLSSIDFKLLSGHWFYVQGHCDLDLWTTDCKTKRYNAFLKLVQYMQGLSNRQRRRESPLHII